MSHNLDFDPRADYYAALGVSPEADDAEIKKAYRRLAKQYHPDATGGDVAKEARFKEVSKAYQVLGDKDKRSQYDALRAGGAGCGGFAGISGAGGVDLGDLFATMFGGANPGGASVRYEVFGGEPGSGFESFFNQGFQGRPRRERPTGRRHQRRAAGGKRTVRAADGSLLTQHGADLFSEVRLKINEALLGTAKPVATVDGTATVKVPPGTSSGTKLRLKGKGMRQSDGATGDHYVTVHIDVPKKPLDVRAQKALAALMDALS
jgi:molecular chaperone DnaJ